MTTPKMQLTSEQLRAIADLTPGTAFDRMHTALTPIQRTHLQHAFDAARSRRADAANEVTRIELARFARAVADPDAPPLPLDVAARQAACAIRDRCQTEEDAAWARIQRLIDRAKELLISR